jgi:hypothetical protein
MIFAILISSIFLTVSLAVTNIAFKEAKFSISGKNTNDALFAADVGAECALYYDRPDINAFPLTGVPGAVSCATGDVIGSGNGTTASYSFIVALLGSANQACAKVTIFKENIPPLQTTITSNGFNTGNDLCVSSNQNLVSRELRLVYDNGTADGTPNFWTNKFYVDDYLDSTGIKKTSGSDSGWDAGAFSVNSFTGDGYVEFTTDENEKAKAVGLSTTDIDQDYTTIEFAIYLDLDRQVRVFESGVENCDNSCPIRSYVPGDVFRVAVAEDIVTYYQNGEQLTQSRIRPAYPLYADGSISDIEATIKDATLGSGGDGGGGCGAEVCPGGGGESVDPII